MISNILAGGTGNMLALHLAIGYSYNRQRKISTAQQPPNVALMQCKENQEPEVCQRMLVFFTFIDFTGDFYHPR